MCLYSVDMEKAKTQTIVSIDQNSKVTAGELGASLGLHELSILVSRAENRSHCQLLRSKINKYYVLGRLEKSCIAVIKLNTFVTQNKKGTV